MLDHHDGFCLTKKGEVRSVSSQLGDGTRAPLVASQIARVEAESISHPFVVVPGEELDAVLGFAEDAVCQGGLAGIVSRVRGDKRAAREIVEALSPAIIKDI